MVLEHSNLHHFILGYGHLKTNTKFTRLAFIYFIMNKIHIIDIIFYFNIFWILRIFVKSCWSHYHVNIRFLHLILNESKYNEWNETSNDIIAEDGRWKVLKGFIFFCFFPDTTLWSFSYMVVHDLMCDKDF